MDPLGTARWRAAAARRGHIEIQPAVGSDKFRSAKPDPKKVPKSYPKARSPSFHVLKDKEASFVARKTPYYRGAPFSCPIPRPKPTCSGIEEALKASQVGADVECAVGEGLNSYLGIPNPDQMEMGLLQKNQQSDQWYTGGRGVKPHCGETRHCIPVFRYAPKLCRKSESIIKVCRQQRIKELWNKLDPEGERVADLFALRPVAAFLDLSERRFLQAVIPSLVQQAISKTSQNAADEPFSLGPKYDEELRLHSLRPGVDEPVKIGTLSPSSRPPRFAQEDGVTRATAEEQQEEQEKQEEQAIKMYRRLAREHEKVVMLDGDQALANASAIPHLFVPLSVFVATCMQLLSHAFGVEGIDQFRDNISYSCRKMVAAVSPEEAKKITKPHVLAFSRKLDLKRQEQQEQEELQRHQRHQQRHQQQQRSRSLPPCGDPTCCIEERKKVMGRRWTRFDAVIGRYVRKRQMQQQNVALDLQGLKEAEACTFHPEINPTPRALRKGVSAERFTSGSKREQRQELLPTDPMVILRQFCSRFVTDERSNNLIRALEECSFQPNAKKYVRQERQRLQEEQQQLPKSKDKEKQKAGCCGGSEEATAAAVDAIFEMLDSPFDAVFKADIRQWLKQEGEDEESAAAGAGAGNERDARLLRQAKLAAAAPKKWILDGREPQHRERRQCPRVAECMLKPDGQPVILLDTTAAAAAAAETASRVIERRCSTGATPSDPRSVPGSTRITNPTLRWKENLRGGYLLPNMNFSLEGEGNREREARREAVRKEDWTKFIRVCARGLEARAMPSQGALQSICDDFTHCPFKQPPTLWEHRRQRRPCLDRGPDARTYTAATAGRAGFAAGLSLARCYEETTALPTVFAVHTPAKHLAMQDSHQLYSQLAREAALGALKLPPKIVGVKRDKVSYLEQELSKLQPPLIVCTDTTK